MAGDFEKFGVDIEINGVNSAVSDLSRFEKRAIEFGKAVGGNEKYYKQEEKQVQKNTKALTSYFAKLTSVTIAARKLGRFFSSAIKESANYIENLNLFAVAFGDTYQQTLDWALDIADAYGLASNEVVRFAGVFRELSNSLGLVDKTADTVTKALTNYGYDLSALFNVSVEQAMEKLQSGIFSGNVRPLRAFGIDISQNQIDALFETNQALAQMGVNARNLSQSDKVIARLVIALQSGTDAFGTMYREINNLQSQFRIFQGSLANFKLAVGDLVQQPIADAMVYINAFIIAITDIIRAFVPLKTIDETPVGNLGTEADEASQALDNLNGKLADFDKFNVIGGQSSGGSQLAVTEALNKLLEEQVALYDDKLTLAMEAATNKATELAQKIRDWFIVVDEKGNFVEWTDNAEKLGSALAFIGIGLAAKATIGILNFVKSLFTMNNAIALANTALLGGMVYAIIKAVEAFNEGDTWGGILAVTIGTVLGGAFIALQVAQIKAAIATAKLTTAKATDFATTANQMTIQNAYNNTIVKLLTLIARLNGASIQKLAWARQDIVAMEGQIVAQNKHNAAIEKNIVQMKKQETQAKSLAGSMALVTLAVGAMSLGIYSIANADMSGTQKMITIFTALAVGITAAAIALAAFQQNWVKAVSIGGMVAGGALFVGSQLPKFADGGYTNANLIMTHENGKREWVGKAAGSSAIVNDTQMSDIMEVAVAKGVYNALSARSAMGGNTPTNETIVVKIGEESVFNAVRKTAKRQGRDFARV